MHCNGPVLKTRLRLADDSRHIGSGNQRRMPRPGLVRAPGPNRGPPGLPPIVRQNLSQKLQPNANDLFPRTAFLVGSPEMRAQLPPELQRGHVHCPSLSLKIQVLEFCSVVLVSRIHFRASLCRHPTTRDVPAQAGRRNQSSSETSSSTRSPNSTIYSCSDSSPERSTSSFGSNQAAGARPWHKRIV